jgi:two-component system response regulator WspF
MRIAIVNDMLLAVEAMRRVLNGADGHQVAWTARTGAEAVERCAKDRPDLVLMDLIMPEMDGVEATRRIMAHTPCAIVVVTASVNDHASKVFEAMGAGALDAVNTPVLAGPAGLEGAKGLLAKVETIRRLISPVNPRKFAATGTPVERPADLKHDRLVVIGASAGGPAALARILSDLPADFPASVAIVQHVDVQFAKGLADWLGGHTPLRVRLAEEGDHPEAGTVVLAGRDHHLVLTSSLRWGYMRARVDSSHRPSVDVFFQSVNQHWKRTVVGVLLTGMGRDGAAGLQALRQNGHHTIAQDEASSAVYGMPKAAVELRAATEILALDKIGPRLSNIVAQRART